MTELSGALDGIGLFPLLNFLGSLNAAGRLKISDRDLSGTLHLTDGRVVGASFGSDSGQVALDAIGLALGSGRFDFADLDGEPPTNLDLSAAELQEHLTHLQSERQRIMAGIPSLESVPAPAMDGPDDQPIAVDRATLRLLLRCDGRASVLELAREPGLLATLKRLAKLSELNLIKVEPRSRAAAPEPVPIAFPEPAVLGAPAQEETFVREPAESGAPSRPDSQPRRPWWQGDGP
jgi:Domain of unknown function (DUF4388)